MKSPLTIGDKVYKYKKDALAHYKQILNSYTFGQSLNDDDFNDLLDLLDYDYSFYAEDEEEVTQDVIPEDVQAPLVVKDIVIAKVQFNTKCFEIIWDDSSSDYISYLMIINRHNTNSGSSFNAACRNAIHDDLRAVKQKYFDAYSEKGLVKCQETSRLSKWEELHVDHRQPHTFSIIVDRFKEVHKIELSTVEYEVNERNMLLFRSEALTNDFRDYHKGKANLRIVRKECNTGRTGMARIKRTPKDLTIE
ncbi:DUF3223 domain-containing protein [Hymenobacter sp. BT770]|uniref:DUF3223 domain-containing protein n=1 Tax=Hymenobacter sp. BT770 TaxID=2886942 RepID=UPI001D11BAD2|nr:DUF3223 domain-containing protein [Hymenobacter sp. BT770]MCC3152793.1 DUF3223 domain-containing protein [Hymenobacter sp. BT770]MDO3414868.1 DUF3223 domain-containing protein [Hymenobacter sp. BT770]